MNITSRATELWNRIKHSADAMREADFHVSTIDIMCPFTNAGYRYSSLVKPVQSFPPNDRYFMHASGVKLETSTFLEQAINATFATGAWEKTDKTTRAEIVDAVREMIFHLHSADVTDSNGIKNSALAIPEPLMRSFFDALGQAHIALSLSEVDKTPPMTLFAMIGDFKEHWGDRYLFARHPQLDRAELGHAQPAEM